MDSPDKPTMDQFSEVVGKIKSANNILVTISTNPTVDQFAACIGLTLVLNKVGKHANAVFSGQVPSTLDFLKPEKTLEKDTDSLRDFIIALDKSKADKLRYKVEDEVVKIFITPYRTSISEKDLEFSQGDFNVEAVIALGVQDKDHIDSAILAHGRILHDAAVISINTTQKSKLGSINWNDERASSLCEMVADISTELDNKVLDSQNATALLTGIVAETDRYSNDKAAPHTMSIAGLLMSAGASTQLVSSKLEEGGSRSTATTPLAAQDSEAGADGVLEISHLDSDKSDEIKEPIVEAGPTVTQNDDLPDIDSASTPDSEADKPELSTPPKEPPRQRVIHEPPEMGGQLTANTEPEESRYSGSTDPMSNVPIDTPMLTRESELPSSDSLFPASDNSVTAKANPVSVEGKTLSDIEKEVDSPHTVQEGEISGSSLDEAREAVMHAQEIIDTDGTGRPEPRQDIASTELGTNLNDSPPPPTAPPPVPPPLMPTS